MKISIKFVSTLIICGGLAVLFQNCSGGGSSSAASDPIFGQWEYDSSALVAGAQGGALLKLDSAGNVTAINAYAQISGGSAIVYYRKSIGTYTRSGDTFTFHYTYETCNPVGTEQLVIKLNPGNSNQITVSDSTQSNFITMYRTSSSSSNFSVTGIEDKNCTILSRLDKHSNRLPASMKNPFIQITLKK